MERPKSIEMSIGKEDEPLPEAPVSVHIDSYYHGFHVGITQRDPEMQTETYSLLKRTIKPQKSSAPFLQSYPLLSSNNA